MGSKTKTKKEETRYGLTFTEWYVLANEACLAAAGVGIDDLPDGPSWDNWDAGVRPEEYANEQLAEEGFPF